MWFANDGNSSIGRIVAETIPGSPTEVDTTPGNALVLVSWEPPADTGGGPIIAYTAVASPSGKVCTSTDGSLTCAIGDLTNGVPQSVTVVATNAAGDSVPSAAAGPVTP